MLAELWQSGMLGALNAGPRTVTELAQASPGLSLHQVSRRMDLYVAGDVLEVDESDRRRRYRPTENTRRAMALVAGLAHWRERREDVAPGSSLTAAEIVRLLSASLPLVVSAEDARQRFELIVKGRGLKGREQEVSLWAEVGPDGRMECVPNGTSADALASGSIGDWIELVVLGTSKKIRIEGNEDQRLQACLQQLHTVLWGPAAASS
jgi:DNA-binding HxlR family transcriptional regulator